MIQLLVIVNPRAEAESLQQKLIETRRIIHMNPELGFQEFETAKLIKNKLKELGIPFKSEIAETGIIAEIDGNNPGKTILLRADMDALPLQESNEVEYRSKNDGISHACGHDTHVSMLLGVAEILKDKDFDGKILLVFQPAEETSPLGYYDVPGGAAPMLSEGGFGDPEQPDYDAAVALHITTRAPIGVIAIRSGPAMGSADEYQITIQGKGGHGSSPNNAVDPVFIACKVYTNIQGFLSRYVDPLEPYVFTIGKIEGGDRHNIISATCKMEGTLRTLNAELRDDLNLKIPEIISNTAKMFGGSAEVDVSLGYPVGVNDPNLAKMIEECVVDLYGEENYIESPPTLGAEDFFEFRIKGKRPACMFWLGAANETKGFVAPNHSNYFNIDENALPMGVAVFVESTLRFLAS